MKIVQFQIVRRNKRTPNPLCEQTERKMGNTSKDLLQLEHRKASTSPLESTLLVCQNASTKKAQPEGKPFPALPLPKSQVLGQVRYFLGVISEANERLKQDAKEPENYDIEVLTGNESQVINMELMLGVADLQTPEAVAAAESAIVVVPLAVNSSGEESEDSSDDDSSSHDSDDEDSSDDNSSDDSDEEDSDDTSDKGDKKTTSHAKIKACKSDKENSLSEDVGNNRSKKRAEIVELS